MHSGMSGIAFKIIKLRKLQTIYKKNIHTKSTLFHYAIYNSVIKLNKFKNQYIFAYKNFSI